MEHLTKESFKKKIYDFEFNGKKLLKQGKEFYGGESFQELILLLDKK